MRLIPSPNAPWMAIGLALVMAATRFHHEGTAFSLPDASLAVFFLAGWYLKNRLIFPALLILAFLIDYAAITYGGVNGYCLSPAYVFLVPTYAAMWWVGCRATGTSTWTINRLGRAMGALLGGTAVSFLISNGSFFLFSGKVSGVSWADYLTGISAYYPGYLISTLTYCGLAFSLDFFSQLNWLYPRWQEKLR